MKVRAKAPSGRPSRQIRRIPSSPQLNPTRFRLRGTALGSLPPRPDRFRSISLSTPRTPAKILEIVAGPAFLLPIPVLVPASQAALFCFGSIYGAVSLGFRCKSPLSLLLKSSPNTGAALGIVPRAQVLALVRYAVGQTLVTRTLIQVSTLRVRFACVCSFRRSDGVAPGLIC